MVPRPPRSTRTDTLLPHTTLFRATVPINPQFGSLNLAQAVILLAYEWSKGEALASPPDVPLDPPAPHKELEDLIDHLVRDLDAAGYFFPPERTTTRSEARRVGKEWVSTCRSRWSPYH